MIDQKSKVNTLKNVDWQYLIREVALFFLFSYLFLVASTHNGLVNISILKISAGILSILLIITIIFHQKSQKSEIELPLLLFLGTFIVSSLLSIDPTRSFTEFWLVLIESFLLLFIINLVKRGWKSELIIKVILLTGLIFMLFSWLEAGTWYFAWLENNPGDWIPDISYRLSVPNFMVVMLNIIFCLSIGRLLFTKDVLGKVVLIIYAMSSIFLIYLTSSRGGWIGTFTGLVCIFLFYIRSPLDVVMIIFDWCKKNKLISVIILIILILGFFLIIQAFVNLSDQPTHAPLLRSRTEFWTPAIKSFIENPVFGQGPYTFFSSYLQSNSVPPNPFYVYVHGIYLDVLSGMGIVGLLTFALLLLYIWRSLVKTNMDVQGEDKAVVLGVAGAFAAFCIHGLVDSVHHTIPTGAWVIAIILGAALGLKKSVEPKKSYSLIIIGVLAVLFSWVNIWISTPLYKGVSNANVGKWDVVENWLEEAVKRSPDSTIAYQQLGLVQSRLYYQGENNALNNAISAFEKAVLLDPYWALNQANLGSLYREAGEYQKAKIAYREAADLAPRCALYWLNLAEVTELLGNNTEAASYYENFIELKPQYKNNQYWQTTEFRKTIAKDWASDSDAENDETVDNLEKEVALNPDRVDPYLDLIDAYMNIQDYDEARKAVNNAELTYIDRDEKRLDLLWYDAELLMHEGDVNQAIVKGQQAIDSYLDQGVYGPGSGGKLLYSQLIFRRPGMSVEFTPYISLLPVEEKWMSRSEKLDDWLDVSNE